MAVGKLGSSANQVDVKFRCDDEDYQNAAEEMKAKEDEFEARQRVLGESIKAWFVGIGSTFNSILHAPIHSPIAVPNTAHENTSIQNEKNNTNALFEEWLSETVPHTPMLGAGFTHDVLRMAPPTQPASSLHDIPKGLYEDIALQKEINILNKQGVNTEKEFIDVLDLHSSKLTEVSDAEFEHATRILTFAGYPDKALQLQHTKDQKLNREQKTLDEKYGLKRDKALLDEITRLGIKLGSEQDIKPRDYLKQDPMKYVIEQKEKQFDTISQGILNQGLKHDKNVLNEPNILGIKLGSEQEQKPVDITDLFQIKRTPVQDQKPLYETTLSEPAHSNHAENISKRMEQEGISKEYTRILLEELALLEQQSEKLEVMDYSRWKIIKAVLVEQGYERETLSILREQTNERYKQSVELEKQLSINEKFQRSIGHVQRGISDSSMSAATAREIYGDKIPSRVKIDKNVREYTGSDLTASIRSGV